jgi:hypothetical protein
MDGTNLYLQSTAPVDNAALNDKNDHIVLLGEKIAHLSKQLREAKAARNKCRNVAIRAFLQESYKSTAFGFDMPQEGMPKLITHFLDLCRFMEKKIYKEIRTLDDFYVIHAGASRSEILALAPMLEKELCDRFWVRSSMMDGADKVLAVGSSGSILRDDFVTGSYGIDAWAVRGKVTQDLFCGDYGIDALAVRGKVTQDLFCGDYGIDPWAVRGKVTQDLFCGDGEAEPFEERSVALPHDYPVFQYGDDNDMFDSDDDDTPGADDKPPQADAFMTGLAKIYVESFARNDFANHTDVQHTDCIVVDWKGTLGNDACGLAIFRFRRKKPIAKKRKSLANRRDDDDDDAPPVKKQKVTSD